ncbi:MAG: hypothetical protein JNK76_25750 [Planctomycetales bacterium]|nr:hypothetical protein [Planctomycetales bacterium]MBN8628835.1 hypothetical protein [Planctomycetota bacterium]
MRHTHFLSVVLSSLLCIGCNSGKSAGGSNGGSPGGSATTAQPEMKDDADSKQFVSTSMTKIIGDNFSSRTDEYREARDWLKDSKNRPVKLERAVVVNLVDDLYAAGATTVYAAGLKPTDDGGVTSSSLVALVSATDDVLRGRVMEVRNKHYAAYLPTVGKVDLVKDLSNNEVGLAVVEIELQH